MGAFTGASLLAMAGAFLASEFYGNFEGAAAMAGGWLGAFTGALLGLAGGLWWVLRQGGAQGGTAIAVLTGSAIMMIVCFAYIAFS